MATEKEILDFLQEEFIDSGMFMNFLRELLSQKTGAEKVLHADEVLSPGSLRGRFRKISDKKVVLELTIWPQKEGTDKEEETNA